MPEGIVVLRHKETGKVRAVPVSEDYRSHVMAGRGYQYKALYPEEDVIRLALPEHIKVNPDYLKHIQREFEEIDLSGLECAMEPSL